MRSYRVIPTIEQVNALSAKGMSPKQIAKTFAVLESDIVKLFEDDFERATMPEDRK